MNLFREGIVASADSTGAKPVECGVPAAVYSPPMAAPTYGVTHGAIPPYFLQMQSSDS